MKIKFFITMVLLIVSNIGFSMPSTRNNSNKTTRSLSFRRLFCPAPKVNEGYQEFQGDVNSNPNNSHHQIDEDNNGIRTNSHHQIDEDNYTLQDYDVYTTIDGIPTTGFGADDENETQGSTEPYETSSESSQYSESEVRYEAFKEDGHIPQFYHSQEFPNHQEFDSPSPRCVNPFYSELMSLPSTTREYYAKLDKLVELIDSVGAMKLFYTHVMIEFRLGNLTYWEDTQTLLKRGLEQTTTKVSIDQSYDAFDLILNKAIDDKVINKHEYKDFEEQAIRASSSSHLDESGLPSVLEKDAGLQHVPEEIVENVNNYLGQIESIAAMKKSTFLGFQDKLYEFSKKNMENRIEAGVGVMGLILNALFCSDYRIGDGSKIDRLVDFADSRLASGVNAHLLDPSNSSAKDLLTKAAFEGNTVGIIVSIAAIIKFNEIKNRTTGFYEV